MAAVPIESKTLPELKVSELRIELEKRGLDKNGIKATLVERLEQALKAEGHDAQTFKFAVQELPLQQSVPDKVASCESRNEIDGQAGDENVADKEEMVAEAKETEKKTEEGEQQKQLDLDEVEEMDADQNPENPKETTSETSQNTQMEKLNSATEADENGDGDKTVMEENVVTQEKGSNDEEGDDHTNAENHQTEEQQKDQQPQIPEEPEIIIVPIKKTIKSECADLVVETVGVATVEKTISEKPEDQAVQQQAEELMDTSDDSEKHAKRAEDSNATARQEVVEQPAKVAEQPAKVPTPKPAQPQKQQRLVGGSNLSASLWIRNITTTTKAADLKALFTKHGKVVTAKIFTTKNKQSPTCFGYVTLADSEAADLCAQKLNRSNFKGRIINVEKADRSNLSQFDKAAQQDQQSQQHQAGTSKSSGESQEKAKTGGKDDAGSSSSANKKSARPRITAIKDSPTKAKESSSSSSIKKRISKTATGSSSKHDYKDNTNRNRYGSAVARTARFIYGQRRDPGVTASYVIKQQQRDAPFYRRIVQQTTRGIRVSTSIAPQPYGSRVAGYRPAPSVSDFGDTRNRHLAMVAADSAVNEEREEMLRLMRRREEEHRKKEEELRLEREREKLRYEREKLERERLELEHMKLTAQMQATTGWIQAAGGLSTAIPVAAVADQQVAVQHSRSSDRHHHRESRLSSADIAKKKETPKGTGSSSATVAATKGSSTSKETHRSSSRSYHRSSHSTSRGVSSDNRRSGASGHRSRSPIFLSRSPIRRSATSSTRSNSKQISSSSTSHRDWSKPASRYMSIHAPAAEGKRDSGGGRNSYGSGGTFQQPYGGSPYGKQYPVTASNSYDRHGDSQRVSSSSQGRQQQFFSTGSSGRYSGDLSSPPADQYASSYAQQQQYATPAVAGGRDDMFANSTFGNSAMMQSYSVPQAQYGREPVSSSFSYSQSSSNWSSNRQPEVVNSRAFVAPSASVGGGGGGWSRQTENILSEWNMYQNKQSTSGSPSGRYQQQSSSYGGRSAGGGGGSSSYASSGRRY